MITRRDMVKRGLEQIPLSGLERLLKKFDRGDPICLDGQFFNASSPLVDYG